ncbi:MAG TPA: DUF5658 family protein [Chthonomonadaceae bacterium]|nr:DUF5658 family protein [Chthonomonadaceae bacterium]
MRSQKIAWETWIIAAIALADLVTTIIFIQNHGAQEANPVFRRYWDMGLGAFVLAKSICVVGPLFILEWARRRKPLLVTWALRVAIVGYLGLYGMGLLRLNDVSYDALMRDASPMIVNASPMLPSPNSVGAALPDRLSLK